MAIQAFITDVPDPTPTSRGEITQAAALLYSFASGTYTLTIPPGCLVRSVTAFITEAFDGTTPTIAVQDADTANGYLASTDIAPATAIAVGTPAIKVSSAKAQAYANGKYYPTGGRLDVVFGKATGSPTTGKCVIIVSGILLPRMGIAAGLTNAAVL